MAENQSFSLDEAQVIFAKRTNQRVWELLEKSSRTPDEAEEMLLAAQASLYHWSKAGTAVQAQRGYWLLAKVYLALKKPASALEAARKCQQITDSNPQEMKDFDLAYAGEVLARAFACSGEREEARRAYQLAEELGAKIKDPEDRSIFSADFQGGDWFGLVGSPSGQ